MIASTPSSNLQATHSAHLFAREKSFAEFEIHKLDSSNGELISAASRQGRMERYEMIWVKSGNGKLMVNGQEVIVFDKFIYCITPGQTYKFFPGDEAIRGYFISFHPSIMQNTSDSIDGFDWMTGCKGLYRESVPDSREVQWELEFICRKMLQLVSNNEIGLSSMFRALLNLLITYFNRLNESKGNAAMSTREYLIYKRFRLLLKAQGSFRKKVSEFADELSVTGNYLNRSVKSISGFPASYHIQQRVIKEAKRQAIQGGLTLKEIAYGLGFESLAHFSKFFKNYSGESFSAFKKNGNCFA